MPLASVSSTKGEFSWPVAMALLNSLLFEASVKETSTSFSLFLIFPATWVKLSVVGLSNKMTTAPNKIMGSMYRFMLSLIPGNERALMAR